MLQVSVAPAVVAVAEELVVAAGEAGEAVAALVA